MTLISVIILTLVHGINNGTSTILISFNLWNEQKRWITAINPKRNKTPPEFISFISDCEQVCCIKPYKAQEADEMTLDFADSFFILRKTTDGWYEGERMSDRQRGWFPSRVVEPVASGSVREENVRE
uniref:SH3 domain-containing protein n=1 Tax=Petromyzon marinus TaxID=7757 RepID=S4RN28_PETMA